MVQNRAVVAKTAPPPPPPPFARQQAAIQANEGRPISVTPDAPVGTGKHEGSRGAGEDGASGHGTTEAQPRQQRSGTMNRNAEPGPLNTNRPVNANPNRRNPNHRCNSNAQSNAKPAVKLEMRTANRARTPTRRKHQQAPNQRADA